MQPTTDVDTDVIDLKEVLQTVWKKRHIIFLFSLGCLVFSAVYAFAFAKPVFESSALLIPTETSSGGQFSAAAALLGKKESGNADVELYQSLLTSRTVIRKILNASLANQSDTGNQKIQPLWSILGIDTSKPIQIDGAINQIAKSVAVGSKEGGGGGILIVKFSANAPWLAQQIGNIVLAIGQDEIRTVRIERSNVILSRLGIAVGEAKREWDSTARILTGYNDRNRSILLPDQMLELSRMQIEKQAKEQKYLLARKEYETQLLEQAKAAPPMMILDPPNLPSQKSSPKRMAIMFVGIAIGFLLGVSWALIAVILKDKNSGIPK